jgi:hemolysin III
MVSSAAEVFEHRSRGTLGCVDPELTPRLRGLFHLWALVASLVAGVVLVILADGAIATVSSWIYAGALAGMFGASALYHRFPWRTAACRMWARRLDHAMIFVFIASSYTPFALLRFHDSTRWLVLGLVWTGAALGLLLELAWIESPGWLKAIAYMTVGWVGVLAAPELFSAVGVPSAILLIAGGSLYTIGAIVFAFKWPNPLPRTLGFHEVFHLLVVAAAVTQFVAVSLIVM